ncbi:MAG: alpha-glucan family phosphorylase [Nitrospiraceae bacterium]
MSTTLPQPIARLTELSQNLWWSWRLDARKLFHTIDPVLWAHAQHNPVRLLHHVGLDRLTALAGDPAFIRQYNAVMKAYDDYLSKPNTWYASQYGPGAPHAFPPPSPSPQASKTGGSSPMSFMVGYFSAEFGFHNSVPIYSGGLGILAGDHSKEASDLGLPFVAIGFMYPQGYFRQRISQDGWQEPDYATFNRDESPLHRVLTKDGQNLTISIELAGRRVAAAIWHIRVGRISLYLLDTDVPENAEGDRGLSARLYGGGHETRLCQEMLLGIGGVRALRALGLNPTVWHANEGHSSFLTLERLREYRQAGLTTAEATELVRQSTVFTTHTPVPAGHDVFSVEMMDRYFAGYWDQLGLTRAAFLRLGEHPERPEAGFNMTALAMRLAAHVNGVSKEHGVVSRQMWQCLWPGVPEVQVPIRHITNGVHVPTWIAPDLFHLYSRHLGPDWISRADDAGNWERITDVPDHELWRVRQQLKRRLMSFIRERARTGWAQGQASPMQAVTRGVMLDPEALTIGFARRFATYKRATLIFRDLDRLLKLMHDQHRPVQLVFAGKAHPADEPGRQFIHRVVEYCQDHRLAGRIAFIEDYDMHMAKFLVTGVDVWLNTPRPPLEASGTSGEKAVLNGVLHFSVLDGWWKEGYDGGNGWGIPAAEGPLDPEVQDQNDALELYRLLETEVVPLYYQRDTDDIPRGWLQVVKQSIRTNAPRFSARRMVKEYMDLIYRAAMTKAPSTW